MTRTAKRDLIVIGASAGGVEALKTVVAGLPADLPAAILVVLHVPSHAHSELPRILSRISRLPVAHAVEDRALAPGTITIAPPDHHLTVRGERIRLSRGPQVNGHRPAVDPLFQTAASSMKNRVIGVILSGALDDGAAGTLEIKSAGGITIVQDPSDALYPGMPRSVLQLTEVDHILPASQIPNALVELAGQPVPDLRAGDGTARAMTGGNGDDERIEGREREEKQDLEPATVEDPPGAVSGMTCPECRGALWLRPVGKTEHYRCRVGHEYTSRGLFAAQSQGLEDAMWAAYRALEESASLARRLGERALRQGLPLLASRYARKQADAVSRAEIVRSVLERGRLDSYDADEAEDEDEDEAEDADEDAERLENMHAAKGA
jgi:two-component system chemotaxis response regulator CheB